MSTKTFGRKKREYSDITIRTSSCRSFQDNESRYGSIKKKKKDKSSFGKNLGKMAPSALLQKIVAMYQFRIEQRATGKFGLYTSGCYDWILPPLPVYVLYTGDLILRRHCKKKIQLII